MGVEREDGDDDKEGERTMAVVLRGVSGECLPAQLTGVLGGVLAYATMRWSLSRRRAGCPSPSRGPSPHGAPGPPKSKPR